MAENTWQDLELPILEEIERGDAAQELHSTESLVGALQNIDRDRTERAVELLVGGGYVEGLDTTSLGDSRQQYHRLMLTANGVRAIGRWPTNNPLENLLALTEHRIRTTDDPDEKSRLRSFLEGATELGSKIGTSILTDYIKQQTGL